MYCPNCNAELPEGSAFCGSCGHNLTQNQQYAAPAAPAAPAYPGYAAYTSYARPMNNKTKKEFLATDASESARSKAKLAVVLCLVAVAVIIAGIVATLSMSIFDIPAVSVLLSVSGAERDADMLLDDLEDELDVIEEEYEMMEDDFSKDERKDIESWMDSANDIADTFSILNLSAFVKETEILVDEYGDEFEMSDMEEVVEGMDALNTAMAGVIVFIVGFFALPILFAVLGGTLKNTALTIIGIIFTAISQLIFCGIIWVALSLVVGVVQAVLCSKVHAEYRDYRMGKLPA